MTTQALAAAQGVFYAATGAWPLVSMSSFEAVTGPKRDHWLVNPVGVLVGVIGVTLIASARKKEPAPDIRALVAAWSRVRRVA
jgi:hypothetical protein